MKSLLLFALFLLNCAIHKETPDVYICDSGKAPRYHYKSNCRGLSNCSYKIVKISLNRAKKEGKTLCAWED
ncbi:hypothetical protein [Pedobacter sp. ASV28]|uniref:hypothetical protein n=1 Tax=Pedobacter sp. ASV28 TaxID=2795123 RepID=UPI0018ECC74C|nr:hypothetical protein [Pedobacter sp. ASV28]